MQLTPEAQRMLTDLARRYGISPDAARAVFESLAAHNGSMAQFNHPDLGGMGQWLRGGMTMIGDMFNGRLKQQVDAFCSDLADALQRMGTGTAGSTPSQYQSQSQGKPYGAGSGAGFATEGAWWPAELGTPSSSGAQDGLRYAVFPAARRLAIRRGEKLELYDTGEHRITGVSQSGGAGDPVFSGDRGTVRIADLQPVDTPTSSGAQPRTQPSPRAEQNTEPSAAPPPTPAASATLPANHAPNDLLALVEKLAELHQKGVLTEEEFTAKKADLLNRL